MESPAQKCSRLATALEDLAQQEAMCLAAKDFAAVIEAQDRAAPLVEYLVTHAKAVTDEKVRQRIATVVELRRKSEEAIAIELAQIRVRLEEVQAKQRRAAKVGPAYGQGATTRRQVSLRG